VAKTHKDAAIGKVAAADGQRMKDAREVAFLEWFAKQQPKNQLLFLVLADECPACQVIYQRRPDISLPGGFSLDSLGTGTGTPVEPPPATLTPGVTPPLTPPPHPKERSRKHRQLKGRSSNRNSDASKPPEGAKPQEEPRHPKPRANPPK